MDTQVICAPDAAKTGVPPNEIPPDLGHSDYWCCLITEGEAAGFFGLTRRTMQGFRFKGGGPRFVRISARCIRYRRIDLKRWADERLRSSTSDPDPGPKPA